MQGTPPLSSRLVHEFHTVLFGYGNKVLRVSGHPFEHSFYASRDEEKHHSRRIIRLILEMMRYATRNVYEGSRASHNALSSSPEYQLPFSHVEAFFLPRLYMRGRAAARRD